ncbi:MAG TPA: YihA family ribosome biogenesis GTP-binding protein [Cyanobacteria bacterium UBA8530]|nr:YihA family ribosome biogenesis GTP-binding protein [Cyanobacteria bacterium UBA8530]
MRGITSEFIASAVSHSQYPSGRLPEIALAGRSNVGKSSFINSLLNRKDLARISSKPGKTQTLNFYLIDGNFYFVDLPGYGYAGVSREKKENWGPMIDVYLQKREELRAVIAIVDIRHPPTKQDQEMRAYLKAKGISTITIATKADKIPRGQWKNKLAEAKEILGLNDNEPLCLYSSENGEGIKEVWREIGKLLS